MNISVVGGLGFVSMLVSLQTIVSSQSGCIAKRIDVPCGTVVHGIVYLGSFLDICL